MNVVKKIFKFIFGGFIVALLAFVWRRLKTGTFLFDNGVSTDRMGTISGRTGECKETVGDVIERQRDLIREIREKQKLEQ